MARPAEAVRLLKEGYSPKEIADRWGISLRSVIQYLYIAVGEGAIKRSDIFFSIGASRRQIIEEELAEVLDIPILTNSMRQRIPDLSLEELKLYFNLRDARVSYGDMYELISKIEINLHNIMQEILVRKYGQEESGWWRKGISEKIRKDCVLLREQDPEPAEEAFCYTNFIHLRDILDKQWNIFEKVLPKNILKDKKGFLNKLVKLNHIRNCIMHPIKGHDLTEDDFVFVREFSKNIDIAKWRLNYDEERMYT